MQLGDRLRILREQSDLTQQQVSDKIKCGYSTYRKYETKSVLPKSKEVIALAKLYGISTDELLGIDTVMLLEYDKKQLDALNTVLKADLPPEIKAERIDKVLQPLLDERMAAFAPPDIPYDELDYYIGRNLRTVRFDFAIEHLLMFALNEVYKLRLEAIYRKGKLGDGSCGLSSQEYHLKQST